MDAPVWSNWMVSDRTTMHPVTDLFSNVSYLRKQHLKKNRNKQDFALFSSKVTVFDTICGDLA